MQVSFCSQRINICTNLYICTKNKDGKTVFSPLKIGCLGTSAMLNPGTCDPMYKEAEVFFFCIHLVEHRGVEEGLLLPKPMVQLLLPAVVLVLVPIVYAAQPFQGFVRHPLGLLAGHWWQNRVLEINIRIY